MRWRSGRVQSPPSTLAAPVFRSLPVRLPIVFLSLLALLLSPAHAASLDTRWQALEGLRADFIQVQRDVDGVLLAESAGRFVLQRPGRFRWDYTEPYAQTIVADGVNLWTYDPDLAQVTRRPAEQALQGTPAALLADRQALTATFEVASLPSEGGQDGWRLTPKAGDGEFSRIDLWMRAQTPVRMVFADALGGITEIRFEQVTLNPALSANAFRFDVPAGVDVVDIQ